MSSLPRRVLPWMCVAAIAGLPAAARAETFRLELKKLDDKPRTYNEPDAVYRMISAQRFWLQEERGELQSSGTDFASVIKEEPAKYGSDLPFRGVATLGSQTFGFVLDSSAPAEGYDRLYLDRNHNGDLTDDEVIEARRRGRGMFMGGSSQREFPRVDLAIEVEGKKLDYAFFPAAYSYSYGSGADKVRHVSVSLSAGVYREGEISLDGRKHRVVLLDFNSTGRFNDPHGVMKEVRSSGDRLYTSYGDTLLVDPDPRNALFMGYDLVDYQARLPLAKIAVLDGKYYELNVSATGDTISLSPYKGPMSTVVNSACERYTAILYSDLGMLKISGTRNQPVQVPVGEWNLYSYRIDLTPARGSQTRPAVQASLEVRPGPAAADAPARPRKTMLSRAIRSWLSSDADAAQEAGEEEEEEDELAAGSPLRALRGEYTYLSAVASRKTPSFRVEEGRTTFMKFGPPYRVAAQVSRARDGEVYLEADMRGSAGETLTDLMVKGDRPPPPVFQIIAPSDEIVRRGKFEFG